MRIRYRALKIDGVVFSVGTCFWLCVLITPAAVCLLDTKHYIALASCLAALLLVSAVLGQHLLRHGVFLVVDRFTSRDQTVEIVDHVVPFKPSKWYREMRVRGTPGGYSRIPLHGSWQELPFYDYCRLVLEITFPVNCDNALVFGGGGCSVPCFLALRYGNCNIDVIESCPRVLAAAREHFVRKALTKEDRLSFHNTDVAEFIQRPLGVHKWQFIFCDVFVGESPPEFIGREGFVERLAELLSLDGVLVVNLGKPSVHDVARCIKSYRRVFPAAHVLLSDGGVVLMATGGERKLDLSQLLPADSNHVRKLSKMLLCRGTSQDGLAES